MEEDNKTNCGFVYVIQLDDAYKIGITKGRPEKRLQNLQTSNAKTLTLGGFKYMNNYKLMEKFLHFVFRHNRLNGEWFKLEKQHTDQLKSLIFADIDDSFTRLVGYSYKYFSDWQDVPLSISFLGVEEWRFLHKLIEQHEWEDDYEG